MIFLSFKAIKEIRETNESAQPVFKTQSLQSKFKNLKLKIKPQTWTKYL